ncbi:hypothetical protein QZH41_019531 [Actinostola sp. cb2023]|nr:hypothetical protein QZH41_019531 [Actinostola sp. cb2023]
MSPCVLKIPKNAKGKAFFSSVVYCGDKNPGAIIAVDVDNKDNKDNEAVVHSFTDEEDLEVFQPTSEWQDIKAGQAIPRGLHVQMSLQTGKKQAKLMDGDDGERYRNHEKKKYYGKENQSKQKFIQIDKNIFSKQHLKDALKDFKDKFHDEKPESDNPVDTSTIKDKKFRSIKEIRKDLEDANLFPKYDIEFIQEYVTVLNRSSSSLHEKEHALNELEYYLHQTDNAVDFNTIGGLEIIIKLLNSTEERLVIKAAYVLGSAAQNNLPVQKAAQNYGALPLLLRLLSLHNSMEVRRKALYGLSSILRLYSSTQQEFLKLNGLELFQRMFNEPGTDILRVKAITLMTDILTEQFDFVKQKLPKQGSQDIESILKQIPLLKAMVKQGWCRLLQNLLNTTENDTREKVLQALNVMVVGCKEEFKNSNVYKRLSKLQTEWQESIKVVGRDEGEYFVQLSQLVSDIKSKLN